ncbi:phosphatase [Endomicrobiia bacterium]|nr:phosphatase [Endomicrobiia bacterium]GHT65742.1 phosphatase [Endomicrobiia bacterium]GHT71555.1 phosphatase [Endomicrobiia bacterium]GHT76449.1 phosphatase [Endomicrobiia bacterium]
MADIKSFRALRYSKETITNFICPPYDVVNDDEKAKLQKLSPFNIINIELPDSRGKRNKYQNAADLLRSWQDERILERDKIPALYFYEQIFEDHEITMTRRGFFASLKLDNPHSGKGSVKPHEKTLTKPKFDRLNLLKATKTNVSPIFGLFEDKNRTVVSICRKITRRTPSVTAKDRERVFHKMWIVTDKDTIETLEEYLSTKEVFIADGHHRYETAWNYLQERKEKDSNYSRDKEYNYVLACLCPMEDPGISIWPTHRIIKAPEDLESNIEKYFDVHSANDFQELSKKEIQPMMIFKDNRYRVLTIKKESFLKKAMRDKCKAYRNLAVSALHYVLIPNVDASEFTYAKDEKEAVLNAKKTGRIAIIVPATPVESLKVISSKNEMMPQKSTYFYPKLASGVVMACIK